MIYEKKTDKWLFTSRKYWWWWWSPNCKKFMKMELNKLNQLILNWFESFKKLGAMCNQMYVLKINKKRESDETIFSRQICK